MFLCLEFVSYDLSYLHFDPEVVLLYLIWGDLSNGGNGAIVFFFLPDGLMVIEYLGMKYFQIDLLVGVIGHCAYKLTGGKCGNLGGGNGCIQLGRPADGSIGSID